MSLAEFVYTVLLKPPLLRRAANATLRALIPEAVRVGEALIWLNPKDPVVSGALALRVFERGEIDFFRAHLNGDMTFVDVGANVGLYTGLALAKPDFRGRIVAIEPHAESLLFLHKTIRSNGGADWQRRAVLCAVAASDRPGSVTLYKNSQNRGDNRLYADAPLDEQEAVSTDTLDNICSRHGIGSVQFLKLDVQGAEAKVLSGARRVLSGSADCILMSEFWPYGLQRMGADGLLYLELVGDLGFTLFYSPRRANRLVPVTDRRGLTSGLRGRSYTNLVGLKGAFLEQARSDRRRSRAIS
ncbi:MAG TPA: FkbM family methyltransferase [Burkholderiales bacterium]|nr:FkbM family methyltransferase [Burkholderiales bacterium]